MSGHYFSLTPAMLVLLAIIAVLYSIFRLAEHLFPKTKNTSVDLSIVILIAVLFLAIYVLAPDQSKKATAHIKLLSKIVQGDPRFRLIKISTSPVSPLKVSGSVWNRADYDDLKRIIASNEAMIEPYWLVDIDYRDVVKYRPWNEQTRSYLPEVTRIYVGTIKMYNNPRYSLEYTSKKYGLDIWVWPSAFRPGIGFVYIRPEQKEKALEFLDHWPSFQFDHSIPSSGILGIRTSASLEFFTKG
jgi:hypothetical protein